MFHLTRSGAQKERITVGKMNGYDKLLHPHLKPGKACQILSQVSCSMYLRNT